MLILEEVCPYWRRCVHIKGGMTLRMFFEVLKIHVRPNVSLPATCESGCKTLSHCPEAMPFCLRAATSPVL